MANSNITKEVIANATKHLMEEIPFKHITTADIIKKCGISRKTFYYHFKDKYDLVNWIFSVEIIDGIIDNTSIDNLTNCYLKLCQYIKGNGAFCTNAINANGQNCLIEFLNTYVEKQIKILCKEAIERQELSSDDVAFLVDYYYSALIGVLKTWIKNDLKDSPEIIVKRWVGVIENNLEHYINTIQSAN